MEVKGMDQHCFISQGPLTKTIAGSFNLRLENFHTLIIHKEEIDETIKTLDQCLIKRRKRDEPARLRIY